jgi:hypothetical protein
MPSVEDFYSVNEIYNAPANRFYHNNSACLAGRNIPTYERQPGTDSFRLCADCFKLNAQGR